MMIQTKSELQKKENCSATLVKQGSMVHYRCVCKGNACYENYDTMRHNT